MSDILDAIDALANASVEAMNKMPEVSDDVSWARKILESIDGVYVKVNTSLSHIIKSLRLCHTEVRSFPLMWSHTKQKSDCGTLSI